MKAKESVYKQCAAAIDRIVQNPPRQHGGVFTEIDVATEAATDDWDNSEYTKSLHDSNEICGQRFRNRRLCRYGPVVIGKGKDKIEDYARIAGKIVYADAARGPDVWVTPNGKFRKMMVEDDHLSRQGRKPAANRNDAEPWSEQALPAKPRPAKSSRSRHTVLKARTERDLERLVLSLAERVESLEEERAQREAYIAEQAKRQRKPISVA